MSFSSLLECSEPDLKVGEKRCSVTLSVALFEGDITLANRNANYTLGPVMLHIAMKPGAVIPAHFHKGMAEALYVAEGDFTNEGKQYQAGNSLHFMAGKEHGRTPLRMGANCSSFGRNAPQMRRQTSPTS